MAASTSALRRDCVQQYITSSGVTCNNKTRLVVFDRKVNAHVYVNQVLAVVVPFMQNNFTQGDGILQ